MKKITALILCLFLIFSAVFMTACNDKNDSENSDSKNSEEQKDTTKDTTKDTEKQENTIETIEPVDTSNIEPGKGGDLVGEWLSDAIPYEMIEGMVANYNTRFIFKEDGTLLYSLSLYSDGKVFEASYEVDGCNIIFGEGLNLTDATFTVDGDILLFNSNELNVAFRRQ